MGIFRVCDPAGQNRLCKAGTKERLDSAEELGVKFKSMIIAMIIVLIMAVIMAMKMILTKVSFVAL